MQGQGRQPGFQVLTAFVRGWVLIDWVAGLRVKRTPLEEDLRAGKDLQHATRGTNKDAHQPALHDCRPEPLRRGAHAHGDQ